MSISVILQGGHVNYSRAFYLNPPTFTSSVLPWDPFFLFSGLSWLRVCAILYKVASSVLYVPCLHTAWYSVPLCADSVPHLPWSSGPTLPAVVAQSERDPSRPSFSRPSPLKGTRRMRVYFFLVPGSFQVVILICGTRETIYKCNHMIKYYPWWLG